MAARAWPVASRGSQPSFWAWVPNIAIRRATTLCPPMAPARLIQPRASSSVTSAKQGVETPEPP